MSMMSRAGTLARKTRRKSGGNAYKIAVRHHYHYHHNRDPRSRRASAPILTPHYPRFIRVPSPISRSAETVALPVPSQSPQASPSKSVSFSTEVEEVLIPRPDSLSVHASVCLPHLSGCSGLTMILALSANAEDCLHEPVVVVAQWIVHFAMLIFLYTIFGCVIFTSLFFRQMAVIFQLMKLFIIFGGIFPCVLHSQANTFVPGISGTVGRILVIGLLIVGNVVLAFLLPKFVFPRCLEPILRNFGCPAPCNGKALKKCTKAADAGKKRC